MSKRVKFIEQLMQSKVSIYLYQNAHLMYTSLSNVILFSVYAVQKSKLKGCQKQPLPKRWNIIRGDTVQVIDRKHPEFGKQGKFILAVLTTSNLCYFSMHE